MVRLLKLLFLLQKVASVSCVAALTSDMARLTAAPTETIQGTALTAIVELLADTGKSRLMPVPNPAVKTSDTNGGRDVLRKGHLHQAVVIEKLGEGIMAAARD